MFAALLLFAGTSVHAQPFVRESNVVSAAAGLGSSLGGFTSSSQTPGLSLQFEKGVWAIDGPGVISLGGYAGYKSFTYSNRYSTNFTYNQKWSYTVFGVRSAHRYNGIKSVPYDVYGGMLRSYNILSYTYDDNNPSGVKFDNGSYGSGIGLSIYLGGRYFFTKNLAALAELGYGVSYRNIGLAFKL